MNNLNSNSLAPPTDLQSVGLGTPKKQIAKSSLSEVDSEISGIRKGKLPLDCLDPHHQISTGNEGAKVGASHRFTCLNDGQKNTKIIKIASENNSFGGTSIDSASKSDKSQVIDKDIASLTNNLSDLVDQLNNSSDPQRKTEIKSEIRSLVTKLNDMKSILSENEKTVGAKVDRDVETFAKAGGELHAAKGHHGIGSAAHQALDKMKGLVDEVNQLKKGFIKELSQEAKAFMEGSDKIKGEIKDIFNGKKDLNTASPEAKQMLVDKGLAIFNNGRLELKKNISKEEQKDFFDNFDDHLIGLYQRNPGFLSPDRSEGRGDMKDETSHGTHSSDASMSKLLTSLNRYAGANLPPLMPITKESAKNLIESMRNELLLQAERNQENRDIQKDIESADLKDRIIKKEVLGREIRNEQISEEGLKYDVLKAEILLGELQKKGDIGSLPFIETINKAISLIVTLEKIPGMKESPEFKTLVREVVSFIAKMTPAIGVNASIGGRIAGG